MFPIKANKVTVTSKYGPRVITVNGVIQDRKHNGIDLVANPNKKNEDILAFEDGVVVGVQKTGKQYGTGCYVRLKHSNGWQTMYMHQKTGTIKVNKGDKVKKGDYLGTIGTTGNSTGVHLHFQIDKGTSSTSVNPWDYLFNGKKLVPDSPNPTPTPSNKYKIGDKVIISGNLYTSSNASHSAGKVSNKITNITRINEGSAHPYNTTGDLGWMNESDISLYKNSQSESTNLKVGDTVEIVSAGNGSSNGTSNKAYGIGWTRTILKIYPGRAYPFQVGNSTGTTGFYKESALKKK